MQAPRVVLVLGAHRSGTSALTRVLALLGASLPSDLMVATADNPTGYWEPEAMWRANDDLLDGLDRSWDDPRPLPVGWRSSDAAIAARSACGVLLDGWLATGGTVLLKDPRLCRLAPLWLDLLADRDIVPTVVLTARPLVESARSLERRDGMSLATGGWLGLVHALEAERVSRSLHRMVAPYGELLGSGTDLVHRLAHHVGLPDPTPEVLAAVRRFLDPSLRHHHAAADDLPAPLDVLAPRVEAAMTAIGGPDQEALDAVAAEVAVLSSVVEAHQAASARRHDEVGERSRVELEHLRHEGRRTATDRDRLADEVVLLQDELARTRASLDLARIGARRRAAQAGDEQQQLATEIALLRRSRALRSAAALRRLGTLGRRPATPPATASDVAFVLVVERGPLEWQTVLFVDSLRQWGGAWSDAPVYALSPRPDRLPRDEIRHELGQLGVDCSHVVDNPDRSGYGTVNRIVAGAHIERSTDHEVLVVVDSDTLVLRPPDQLALAANVDVAARAVDTVGLCASGPEHPMAGYWSALCALAGGDLDLLPTTTTTVDRESILANYNGGLVAVRRDVGILQRLEELYFAAGAAGLRPRVAAPAFRAGAGPVSDDVAAIFGSAQAALSVAAWSLTRRVVELPATYNVPVHLLDQLPPDRRAAAFPGAVHVHYHWLLDADVDDDPLRHGADSPLDGEQREWLDARLRWRDVTGS